MGVPDPKPSAAATRADETHAAALCPEPWSLRGRLRCSAGFFDRVRTGELMNRLSEVSTAHPNADVKLLDSARARVLLPRALWWPLHASYFRGPSLQSQRDAKRRGGRRSTRAERALSCGLCLQAVSCEVPVCR